MKYSIVIPTFNAQDTIKDCLDAVCEFYDKDKIEIIICDNNSTDNTLEIIKKYPFKIFKNNKSQSAGSTRNLGAKKSLYENLIFLDSDCIAPKNLIYLLESTPNFNDVKCVAGNFSVYNKYDNFFSLCKTSYVHLKLKKKRENVLNAGIMFIKKKYFFEVGMFKENLISMEDDEFLIRFQAAGYKIIFNPKFEVDHYKKYSFFSLTKNDYERSKQLVTIAKEGMKSFKVKSKVKTSHYKAWINSYFKPLVNCIIMFILLLSLINFFYEFIPFFESLNNLKFILLVCAIYFLNNLDILIFNMKKYNIVFSFLAFFFQIFTLLTIIAGVSVGILSLFFLPKKK